MADTLVLQSHRTPLPDPWWRACLGSVRAWAAHRGYAYRFAGDEIFALVPDVLRARCADRPVVATDLARLAALERALDEGFDTVVWLDADVLVVRPDLLELPDAPYALGRQIWVQGDPPRVFRQVHNAALMFRPGNPFLRFYRHAAERVVARHDGPMVPQLVGPKLLTALHNLVACPVIEAANMLSPWVVKDLLAGGGPHVSAYVAACAEPPAAVNLCGSAVASGDLTTAQLQAVIDLLVAEPARLAPPGRRRAAT